MKQVYYKKEKIVMKKPLFLCSIFLFNLLFSQESSEDKKNLSISIPSGVDVQVSGEVEVEFIDVEGSGGAMNEDEFLRKIETRSPHTRIDKAILDFKLLYSKNISYRFSLRFDDDNAYADKHYLTIKNANTKIELGKNRPHIALKREIEGYPLIGTAYWKGREYHADIEQSLDNIGVKLGSSIALKRPLGYDDAAEDKSFKMLVYDDGEKTDGQTVELGVRAKTNVGPLNFSGWYYYGKLIDDEDWKKRLHYDFDWYSQVEADTVLNKDANRDHYWYGGRASILLSNILIRAEYIKSIDGFLPRDGFYTEIRTKIPLFLKNDLLFLARYGELNIDRGGSTFYPMLKDAHTWDKSLSTIALVYDITHYSKLKFEYYIINEKTGDTKESATLQNREYQPSVRDNQLLIQLELNF